MRVGYWGLSFGCLVSTSLLPAVTARGILAIDYGTQFMKLSLVQPGIPFDVLLNHDSKRKTQSVVSVRGEDKLIGDDAAALAARYPQNSYPGLKLLLGQPIHSPAFNLQHSLYNIPATGTPRGTIQLVPNLPSKGNTTITYLPEELIALQFSYARELADAASANNVNAGVPGLGGEKITDCIITVPGFFNQFERKALLDSAELAGLKVLNLIDDGASFGVNYAMMRTFGNKKVNPAKPDAGPGIETHLFYDVGAASIKATIVEFSMFEEKIHVSSKTKKNVTLIDVKGYGHQRNIGGLLFDRKIRDILKDDFKAQTKIDVSDNARAMTKLLRESTRVKQVLSANAESQTRIEGLVDEHDFKSSLTRQKFEESCADEIPKFTQPIVDALQNAKMSMADIKSVILVGGSSRVPMVQAAVKSLVGEDKIAVNVNADEAAVMGAALYGAGISRQFKTKDVRIRNISPHAISASYNVTKSLGQADSTSPPEVASVKTISTTLFPVGSKLGGQKIIKMKKGEDFSVQLDYLNQPDYFPSSLLNITIHGISAALSNYTNTTGSTVPIKNTTVKLLVGLDESELIVVPEAKLIFPKQANSTNESTIADKIAGFFTSPSKKEDEETIEEVGSDEDKSSSSSKSDSKDESKSATLSELDKAKEALKAENSADGSNKKLEVEYVTIKLTVTRQNLGISPMSTKDKIASGKFLRELKAAETRKRNREEARNALEAYTYKLRDRLDQTVFQSYSTEEEINNLKESRNQVSDWLNDWAEQAPLKELKEKKQQLERLESTIQKRISETEQRPAALQKFNETLTAAIEKQKEMTKLITTTTTKTEGQEEKRGVVEYTEEELKGFKSMVENQENWFTEIQEKLNQIDLKKDSPVSISDIQSRINMIQNEVAKLSLKKSTSSSKKNKKKSSKDSYSTKPDSKATHNATGTDKDGQAGHQQQQQESTENSESNHQQQDKSKSHSESQPESSNDHTHTKDEL